MSFELASFNLLVANSHAHFDLMQKIFRQREFSSPVERKLNILLRNLQQRCFVCMMPCSEQNLIVHRQIHSFGGFCQPTKEANHNTSDRDPRSQPSYPNLEYQGNLICLVGCAFKAPANSKEAVILLREHYV